MTKAIVYKRWFTLKHKKNPRFLFFFSVLWRSLLKINTLLTDFPTYQYLIETLTVWYLSTSLDFSVNEHLYEFNPHPLLGCQQGVVGSGMVLCAKSLWSSLFLYFLLSPSFFSWFVVPCDCWLFADFFSLSLCPFSRRALRFLSVRHPVLRENL